MSDVQAQETAPEPPGPVLLSRGVYSLYETPDGAAVLSYRPEGQDEDSHQPIPPGIWQLLGKATRGEKVSITDVMRTVSGLRG